MSSSNVTRQYERAEPRLRIARGSALDVLRGVALAASALLVAFLAATGIWVDWSLSPCEGHRELRWAWDSSVKSNAETKIDENIRRFLAVQAFHQNLGEGNSGPLWMDCAACNRKLTSDSERERLLQRIEKNR